MLERKITIKNKLGLHARAAAKFVKVANRFSSSVKIIKDEIEIDGKSILGILTLAATKGTKIILRISGSDEAAALRALINLVKNKFQEIE
jgi:phosphocarrier protein HPr